MARPLIPALFVLLWSTGFIGARYAMPHAEPFGFLTVRFAVAGILLALAAWLSGRALPRGWLAVHAAIAGMFIHGIYLGGVFWAVRNGMPAGLSALIVALQPLLTAVFARAMLAEPVQPRQWAGLALGLAGIALVLGPKLGSVATGTAPVNIAACFIGVVAIAFGSIWQKRHAASGDLVSVTAVQYAGATAVTLLFALLTETGQYELTGELVFAFLWLVFVLSIGAIVLLMRLIAAGSVSNVASLFYLVPVITALIAFVLFGERLDPMQVLGMAVTIAAVAMATSRRPRAPSVAGGA